MRQQHDAESLNIHHLHPAHNNVTPVLQGGAVVSGDILGDEMRVKLHSEPLKPYPGG